MLWPIPLAWMESCQDSSLAGWWVGTQKIQSKWSKVIQVGTFQGTIRSNNCSEEMEGALREVEARREV